MSRTTPSPPSPPRSAEQRDQEHGIEHEHRARDVDQPVDQEQREPDAHRAQHRGANDVPQVLQARETPHPAVQAVAPGQHRLQRDGEGQGVEAGLQMLFRRQAEIETRDQRQHPRERDGNEVVQDDLETRGERHRSGSSAVKMQQG
jgi:hypothetical protein